MLYDYIALVFFVLFAIFIPVSFLFASKALGKKGNPNEIKNSPYESAEESNGKTRAIDSEYAPYLMIFVPFEIIAIILILWAASAKSLPYIDGLLYIGIAVISTVFAFISYKLINDKYAQ